MAAEKVSHDAPEYAAEKEPAVVLNTLDAGGRQARSQKAAASAPLSTRQSLSAYFTIAAAAFGLIRYALIPLACLSAVLNSFAVMDVSILQLTDSTTLTHPIIRPE